MEGAMTTHVVVNPPELIEPKGFSHAIVAGAGTTVYLAGITAHRKDGSLPGPGLVEQFDGAAGNVVVALRAAGAAPEHLVSMIMYVTEVGEYRSSVKELLPMWRKHFGRYYPAAALIGVSELVDPAAKVELVCTAVIPA